MNEVTVFAPDASITVVPDCPVYIDNSDGTRTRVGVVTDAHVSDLGLGVGVSFDEPVEFGLRSSFSFTTPPLPPRLIRLLLGRGRPWKQNKHRYGPKG